MNINLFAGLAVGVGFGILLQRSEVLRYDRQIGALRLMDMTIVKFMLSAVIVGMFGIYLLRDLGMAELNIKPAAISGNVIGGLIFGAGWALLGYCPGTAVGALAEGYVDAFFGILGMIVGAMLFAEFYPLMDAGIFAVWNLGRMTLVSLTGWSPWPIIIVLSILYMGLFYYLERRDL